jgi:glycerol-3-phosphate dehydrogenase
VSGARRILFVSRTGKIPALGTTEVSQENPDQCAPSDEEIAYLMANYNRCFCRK